MTLEWLARLLGVSTAQGMARADPDTRGTPEEGIFLLMLSISVPKLSHMHLHALGSL